MAFNWAGAGAGAQDALMEAVRQSLLQREMATREQQAQQQAVYQQGQLAAQARGDELQRAGLDQRDRHFRENMQFDREGRAIPKPDPHLKSPEAIQQEIDAFEKKERIKANLKPVKVAGSGAAKPSAETPDGMKALADMVRGNPDLLKDMSPAQRGKVMEAIAATGGGLPNRDAEQSFSIAQQGLDTIRTLKNTPWQSAVGAGWGTIGMDPPAGTMAAGALPLIDQLVALMALPEVKVLKGMGHMSDMEFGVIKQAATRLNRKIPDADFARELDNLESVLTQVLERRGAAARPGVESGRVKPLPAHGEKAKAPAPTSGPSVGERRVINGQVGVWDGRGWAPEGGR
jgi:hypothetical protein